MNKAILLISCKDQKGITTTVTGFVYQHHGNIVHADQHIDEQSDTFFMRLEWSLDGFGLPQDLIADAFKPIAQRFDMSWELSFTAQPLRLAVFVSNQLHCLYDLLWRKKAEHLLCEISLIISNHPGAQTLAEDFKIRFAEFPIFEQNKNEQEERQLALLAQERIDLIVLARYHQILSPGFVSRYRNKIINIHHSFLPAFPGKHPYSRAYEKGVKIIGATSHFVTEQLDEGPIIEQDTVRISHRDALEDLKRKGEDLEKIVLSRAVRWVLQRKILCYANKTVIFD